MSGKIRTVTVVITGILLASSIIIGITLLQKEGFLPGITSTNLTSSTGPSGITTRTSITTTTSVVASTRVTSTSSLVQSSTTPVQIVSGNLVLQLHDPPHVPPGVTSVFVAYSDILLRSFNGTWYDSKISGSIDLMSIVNFTQTIANLNLYGGKFDQLQMRLSSVVVTSNSKNYSAALSTNQLAIPILGGGLTVFGAFKSGMVIDVSPTVIQQSSLNSTGGTVLSFVFVPSADAYVIPQNQLFYNMSTVGEREDISSQEWLVSETSQTRNQTALQISNTSLSGSGLTITVKNTGNTSVLLQTAFIEANVTQYSTGEDDPHRYNLGNAILFGVLNNGSLVPFTGGEIGDGQGTNIGYNLSAGAQVTLSFTGSISSNITTETSQTSDESNVVTTTISQSSQTTTTTQTGSEGGDNSIGVPMDGLGNAAAISTTGPGSMTNGFQVNPGTTYNVGVTTGDLTLSTTVTAT